LEKNDSAFSIKKDFGKFGGIHENAGRTIAGIVEIYDCAQEFRSCF
jgi:hypothetical protein